MTQNEQIIQYMKEYGSITTMGAFNIGVTRLASRIHDIKRMGYSVKSETIKYTAQDGKKKHYSKYSLAGEK